VLDESLAGKEGTLSCWALVLKNKKTNVTKRNNLRIF
jgi:hypothetical protein